MRIPNIISSVGAAALLLTASAGIAFAKDEGRYVSSHDAYDGRGIYLTDTKKGRIKYCRPSGVAGDRVLNCTPWAEADD